MNVKNRIQFSYFLIIAIIIVFGFIAALMKATSIMYLEDEYWAEVNKINVKDSIVIKANRGNIFSADGKLLASSIPEYELRMDLASNSYTARSIKQNITAISKGLSEILHYKTPGYFKNQLNTGIRNRSKYKLICPRRINYIELQKIKQLPLFKEGRFKSGLTPKEFNYRKKPFETLASRTIGDMYADLTQGAKNGLELQFNNELKGTNGKGHLQRVRNASITVTDTKPIDGSDIITTIDVDIQDLSEKTIRDIMTEYSANQGIALIMEVKTGDIKAVVNLTRTSFGYQELNNHAFSDLYEQGSTVKTASILIALDDDKITRDLTYDLGNGSFKLYNRWLKDHNFSRGGFKEGEKVKNVDGIMMQSSNIGVGRIIEDHYKNDKQHFVDRFRELLGVELNIPIPGSAKPIIKDVDNPHFSKTTLAWMSFGYETMIPPINIVTFYNAIANNGTMLEPRLVTAIEKDGQAIETFPTKVLNSQIASNSALDDIKDILIKVVEKGGTAHKYGSSTKVKIAGKTGSAQIANGAAGYRSGNNEVFVSFCGYFPAEEPMYTCLVSFKSSTLYASGGRESAAAVKEIAEKVYALKINRGSTDIDKVDEDSLSLPHIKRGLTSPTLQVLDELDLDYKFDSEEVEGAKAISINNKEKDNYILNAISTNPKLVPSVYGMGAKDAIFILESAGLNVSIVGKGAVYKQSIRAGQSFKKGTRIVLHLH